MDHHHGPITAILAAMTRLGEADAKKIAVEASVAYSTTVKKLRGLAADGRATGRDNGNGPTLWRTTATENAPGNHGSDLVDAEAVTDLDTAPTPVRTTASARREAAAEPDLTDPDRDVPTTATDSSTADESPTRSTVDQDADPGPGEPTSATRTDQPSDTTQDTAIPETGAEPRCPEPGSPEPSPAEARAAQTSGPTTAEAPAARRGKGTLRNEVLAVLQRNPDTAYKVSQLSKLLSGASQGAITNALHKLVTDGTVAQTVERPATYQAD